MKVLYLDIETSPNIVYSWAVGRKISLTYDNIIKERQIICICYKWDDERTVHAIDWGSKQNDKSLLKAFLPIINSADLVVAQNGDRYDLRFINGRLAYHDLDPLHQPTTIDTLKLSRKVFFLNSHALDYMGQFFHLGRKLETGFGLWKGVMDKDPKALSKMVRYCKQDVLLLEKAYKHIRRYTTPNVHIGVAQNGDSLSCEACGSENTMWKGDRIKTKILYKCRKCKDCGHFWRTSVRA